MTKIIKPLLYLVLLTPLVYSAQFLFPFVVPKYVYFITLMSLLGILAIYNKLKIEKTIVTIIIGTYTAISLITSVLGVDLVKSLFGNFERSTGLIMLIGLYAYYLILRNTDVNKRVYLSVATIIISLVSFIGLLQWLGGTPLQLFTNPHGKVWSTLGNYIYLGNLAVFGVFFSAYLYNKANTIWLRLGCVSMFILNFVAIFLAGSRGSAMGILLGTIVTLIVYFKQKLWQKN